MQQLKTTATSRLPIVWLAIAGAVVLVVYIALAWAIPRGFDWTDEAWIYSLIGSNRVSVGEAWGFQHVLHPLFVATGQSVIVFRTLRLIGYFLVSAFLLLVAHRAGGAMNWTLGRVQWIFIFVCSQIGTFLAWSYPPRTLGYDELSAWFTQIGAGLLVLIVVGRISDRPVVGTKLLWVIWAALGFIAVFLLVVKVTSGIAFSVVGVAALFIGSGQLGWIKRVLATLSGIAVGAIVLLVTGFPFVKYVQDLLSLVFNKSAQTAYAHPIGTILKSYAESLESAIRTLAPTLLLITVLIALLSVLSGRWSDPGRKRLVVVVAILIAVLTCVLLVILPSSGSVFEDVGYRGAFLGATAVIVLALLLSQSTDSPFLASAGQRWALAFGVLVVVAAPFISAVGTNNTIVGELLYSSTIWAMAGAVALVVAGSWLLERGSGPRLAAIPSVLLVLLVVIAAIGVEQDFRAHPYRTPPYATQNTATHARFVNGLLLTAPAAAWADWMTTESSRLHAANVATVGISSPGGVLTFNNSGFASPWVETFWPVSFASIKTACTTQGRPHDMFVLQPESAAFGSPVVTDTQKALQTCGINFPADFTTVAHHTSSDPGYTMTIWRLKPTE